MTTIPAPVATAARPTELRLALAIRGGVSLAVWMGGACSEIAALRASAGPNGVSGSGAAGSATYRRLLELAGYDAVTVDVIAGTSAGGLNGVLLSQHLVCGAQFGPRLRDLWLTVGDLAELMRSASFEPAPSLLKGTDGFYVKVKAAMERLAPEHPDVSERPVRLLVTATRLHPRDDALFPTTGYPVPAGRARAFFRFRHQGTEHAEFTDFTEPSSRDRLAFAARTTSSFPGAFEPARAQVAGDATPAGAVDMRGVSSETGVPDENDPACVQLMDGGVLNNIPIGWAVRTIAGMPADTPVDRWLVFLQPVSDNRPSRPRKPGSSGDAPSPARVVSLLRSMLSVKLGSESVLDGLQDLRSLVAESVQLDAVLEATVGTRLADQTDEVVGRAVAAYREATGQAEAARLRSLLTDPLTTIAADPLPLPAETFPLRGSIGASGGDEVDALRVGADVGDLVLPDGTGLAEVGVAARTPALAARVVTMLLYVVRSREAEVGHVFSSVREDLYGLRLAIETITAIRDRRRAAPGERMSGPLRRTTAPDGRRRARGDGAKSAVDSIPAGASAAATWRARAAALAAAHAAPAASSDPVVHGWTEQPFAAVWAALVDAAVAIDTLLKTHDAPADRLLGDGTGRDAVARSLAATEVLTGAMRPDPLAAASNIKLAVCSASNVSPIEDQILAATPTADTRPDLKLSGNQISNFAAFLSARWRLNDWIWGRMDGALTLVNAVAGEGRLARVTTAQLHELFTGPPDLPDAAAERLVATLEARWHAATRSAPTASRPRSRATRSPNGCSGRSSPRNCRCWSSWKPGPPATTARRRTGPRRDGGRRCLELRVLPRRRPAQAARPGRGRVGVQPVPAFGPAADVDAPRVRRLERAVAGRGGRQGGPGRRRVDVRAVPARGVAGRRGTTVDDVRGVRDLGRDRGRDNEWGSGASIPVALSFILAATVLTVQQWVPRAGRRKRAGAGFPAGSAWSAPLAAALAAALL